MEVGLLVGLLNLGAGNLCLVELRYNGTGQEQVHRMLGLEFV